MDDFDNLTMEVINEQILKLRKQNFTWTAITRFFSVTHRKMQAYIRRHGIEDPYTLVEDNADTRQIIQQYVSEHHNAGEVVIKSYLRGLGFTIRRDVLRAILKDLDPEGQQRRRPRGKTPRVHYDAYGPGYIWHVDTWHKLGLTAGIVVVCMIVLVYTY